MVFCVTLNLGLIHKEYVLVKRLIIMFPVMFISSVYADDEKELIVEFFRSGKKYKKSNEDTR